MPHPCFTIRVLLAWLALAAAAPSCFMDSYPKTYVNYFTHSPPIIDGQLDDHAWAEVAWTDLFEDIQGTKMPAPRFHTRAKLRWDNNWLYVAGYIQEPQIWANMTEHNSVIFNDNDFEMFINPDGSNHFYKEFEMNARNTTWELCLNKPYMNGGYPNSSWQMPTMHSAVYIDGKLNDPHIPAHFWTVELAFPLHGLAENNSVNLPPRQGDRWRLDFSRVEWGVEVIDGHYVKIPNRAEDNWVWSSMNAINMHIPYRWGYLQFSKEPVNATKVEVDPEWAARFVLTSVYEAEREFSAINGYYTDRLDFLNLDPIVFNNTCIAPPSLHSINEGQFTVIVKTQDGRTGTMDETAYLTFTI